MKNIPQIINSLRIPCNIPDYAYLQDHCFEDKAVLPGVEACELLARVVKTEMPETDISVVSCAEFKKFLFLEPIGSEIASDNINSFCDLVVYDNNQVRASLVTRRTGKKSFISRTMEHASMTFGQKGEPCSEPVSDRDFIMTGERLKIPLHKIYGELVMFGPSYRNIIDDLYVFAQGLTAKIKAPLKPEQQGTADLLGSPFVVDAAFHAACVWGQRFHNFVPFPVGFEERIIHKKTEPGNCYTAQVIPLQQQADDLILDIWIFDEQENLYESALGVRMRDVSRGRIRPPEWISRTGEF